MNEGLGAHLFGKVDDGYATSRVIRLKDYISLLCSEHRVLVGDDVDEEHVWTDLLDLVDRCCTPRNTLDQDDGLDIGISGHAEYLLDRGLLLIHELVGVGYMDYSSRVLPDHLLCSLVRARISRNAKTFLMVSNPSLKKYLSLPGILSREKGTVREHHLRLLSSLFWHLPLQIAVMNECWQFN
ncbi:MAG: hypothetical protein XE01_1236 [Synergistales bacterium 58_81]|nr:MAG: hypothetical protein XE01_1236 [Synergistales bacterium 58_81]